MRRLRSPLREDPEVFRSAARGVPEVRRPRPQADVVARVSVQGQRLVHHRLRARRTPAAAKADGGSSEKTASKDSKESKESKRDRRTRKKRPAPTRTAGAKKAESTTRFDDRATSKNSSEYVSRGHRFRRPRATAHPSTSGTPLNLSARSGRRSAKYTTAFRNPSLLPVSCRTPLTSHA